MIWFWSQFRAQNFETKRSKTTPDARNPIKNRFWLICLICIGWKFLYIPIYSYISQEGNANYWYEPRVHLAMWPFGPEPCRRSTQLTCYRCMIYFPYFYIFSWFSVVFRSIFIWNLLKAWFEKMAVEILSLANCLNLFFFHIFWIINRTIWINFNKG